MAKGGLQNREERSHTPTEWGDCVHISKTTSPTTTAKRTCSDLNCIPPNQPASGHPQPVPTNLSSFQVTYFREFRVIIQSTSGDINSLPVSRTHFRCDGAASQLLAEERVLDVGQTRAVLPVRVAVQGQEEVPQTRRPRLRLRIQKK